MIQPIPDLPDGTIGFRYTGKVTASDYKQVMIPVLDEAIETHHHIKALVILDDEFESCDLGAAWEDARAGLRHWRGFERVAIVSDNQLIRVSASVFGAMAPCPVKLFVASEQDEARLWLSESLGSIHLDRDGDVISVQLLGKLDPQAYEKVDSDLTNLISHTEHMKLFLDLRQFDGWSGLSALSDHLTLIREHRHSPEKVAVVGSQTWEKVLQRIVSRFINAESKYFDAEHADEAKTWLTE